MVEQQERGFSDKAGGKGVERHTAHSETRGRISFFSAGQA